jgi:hypothetical protein
VDMEAEDITVDIMAGIMAAITMAVGDVFSLEHSGGPDSIIGDGRFITPITGDGLIPIPIIGDGHTPIPPIPIIPILFLQLLRQNRKNSNLIIGISVRTQRVTTPTSKIVRAVGCRWYHRRHHPIWRHPSSKPR